MQTAADIHSTDGETDKQLLMNLVTADLMAASTVILSIHRLSNRGGLQLSKVHRVAKEVVYGKFIKQIRTARA